MSNFDYSSILLCVFLCVCLHIAVMFPVWVIKVSYCLKSILSHLGCLLASRCGGFIKRNE